MAPGSQPVENSLDDIIDSIETFKGSNEAEDALDLADKNTQLRQKFHEAAQHVSSLIAEMEANLEDEPDPDDVDDDSEDDDAEEG